ncbi:MAG: hypothetical protein BWY55_00808 [archaeon ADurb.Bin336]|nr:MAG: hypothetical protein BWY55_00808 [archaeon ADurb.Bin336]
MLEQSWPNETTAPLTGAPCNDKTVTSASKETTPAKPLPPPKNNKPNKPIKSNKKRAMIIKKLGTILSIESTTLATGTYLSSQSTKSYHLSSKLV